MMPGFAWINDDIEHSDEDYARAEALAKRISHMRDEDEKRMFARMADEEDGRYYDPGEGCECGFCLKNNHDCDEDGVDGACTLCADGAICTLTECETVKDERKRTLAHEAERDLEIELCEDKLEAIGARMMRPYEHWNEDEAYMAWSERDR